MVPFALSMCLIMGVGETTMTFQDVTELSGMIHARTISCTELTDYYLQRIERYDPLLRSHITVCAERVRAEAARADAELASGSDQGVLHGIPVGLKDLIATRGVRTTAGSAILADCTPSEDAALWSRLQGVGAILLGKHNLHEFAYGTTTENPHYGTTRNPFDTARIAGGSSGGSAVAVAVDLSPFSIGTDTGGSIRIPASFTGIYGLKPTFGLVSTYGVTPLAFSLDHAGPLARSVRDLALALNVISGYDALDPGSVAIEPTLRQVGFGSLIGKSLAGLRIGYEETFFCAGVDREVVERMQQAILFMQEMGAVVSRVSIQGIEEVPRLQTVTLSTEAFAYHQPWLDDPFAPYGKNTRDRLNTGRAITGADYARAQRERWQFRRTLSNLFADIDILVTPTLSSSPTPIGEQTKGNLTRLTNPFNLTGFPALTVPCGVSRQGLPIGVQLAARPFAEVLLLQCAAGLEQAYPWLPPPDHAARV